jgi:hypothetical protein
MSNSNIISLVSEDQIEMISGMSLKQRLRTLVSITGNITRLKLSLSAIDGYHKDMLDEGADQAVFAARNSLVNQLAKLSELAEKLNESIL